MNNNYKIIIDSSGELPENLKNDGHYVNVPLSIDIDGETFIDDENFDQIDFLERTKKSPNGPKSACPSPESYMAACEGEAKNVYIITLSGELSGSYNSAVLAADLYNEEHEDEPKNIHVFNSKSASIGETLIGLKVQEFEEMGCSFEEVVENVEKHIDTMHTFFVLDTLDTFVKTGRISQLKAGIVSTLNIKPIMASTEEGAIYNAGQGRGSKGAIGKMVEKVISATKKPEDKVIAISHCNCPERADFAKKKIEALGRFKDIIVVNMSGLSSMYANQGGVIVAV
ncbi:MAG: DegV family protein [Lachnospiraceae bacterium]|nr:DegV family protein [Lachnospiraceae bacterium]